MTRGTYNIEVLHNHLLIQLTLYTNAENWYFCKVIHACAHGLSLDGSGTPQRSHGGGNVRGNSGGGYFHHLQHYSNDIRFYRLNFINLLTA